MKSKEVIRYSKNLLRGKRMATMLVCFLPLSAELFFRFAEATVYSMVLYLGDVNPLSLFSGENPVQVITAVSGGVMRWLVCSPLVYACCYRLCEICCENRRYSFTPLSDIILDGKNFRRSLAVSLWTKIIGLVSLVPSAFFGVSAYVLITDGTGTDDFFLAVHAVVLAVVSLFMWVNVRIAMLAVPFLMAHYPHKSVLRLVFRSFKFMHGRYSHMIKIFSSYIIHAVTLILIPYAVAEAMTAFALSISIFVREDEYAERIKNNRKLAENNHSAKLPYRRKRLFKAFADKT